MKIYISHSKEFNYKTDLYAPIKENSIYLNHEIIFPHDIFEDAKDFITKDIIKNCDLFIVEVSFPSTGSGIELGIASTFGIPIICIYKKNSKISGSLKVICNNFIEYNNKNDMIEKIEDFLNKTNIK